MVYRQGERETSMERSKPPLHNFPMDLTWGNQILLRCMNVNSNGDAAPASSGDRKFAVERRFSGKRVEPEFERGGSSDRGNVLPLPVRVEASSAETLRIGYDGIEALRKEIMSDLHSKADKVKDVLREGLEIEKDRGEIPPSPANSPTPPPAQTDSGATMPWKLRTRRAACKEPMNGVNGGGGGGGNGDGGRSLNVDASRKPNNLSPLRNESRSQNSGGDAGAATSGQKRKRAKFSCSLSRSEIEQDFLAMTGHRLPRRPKKRPRAVQKILENLSPAMWLTEVHPDDYKVPDAPENGKRW